jgi:sterol 14alpha-demethylase
MAVDLSSLPWYAYLAGLGLMLSLAVLLRAVLHKFPGSRPPVYEEIPFIGGLIGFIRSPIELATRGYKAVGEVSSVLWKRCDVS